MKHSEDGARQELEEQDYYWDGEYCVFTAAYHRKRGYCCNSGCRHCPYTEENGVTDKEVVRG